MRPPHRHSSSAAIVAQPDSPEPPDADAPAWSDVLDSPTLPPPFDLEEFAREQMGHTESRVAPSDRPTQPAPDDPSSSVARLRSRPALPAMRSGTDALRTALAERFFAADYVAALALADELVSKEPGEPTAKDFAVECRRMLERAHLQRLGSLDCVPRLSMTLQELRNRALDHQTGFLLSRVDGSSTLETLLDVCGMPRLDALVIVAKLVEDGILRLDPER